VGNYSTEIPEPEDCLGDLSLLFRNEVGSCGSQFSHRIITEFTVKDKFAVVVGGLICFSTIVDSPSVYMYGARVMTVNQALNIRKHLSNIRGVPNNDWMLVWLTDRLIVRFETDLITEILRTVGMG